MTPTMINPDIEQALGSSNWILGLSGYDGGEPGSPPPLTQPESVITALKVMTGKQDDLNMVLIRRRTAGKRNDIPIHDPNDILQARKRTRSGDQKGLEGQNTKRRLQGLYRRHFGFLTLRQKHVKKEEAEEKFIELSEESQ